MSSATAAGHSAGVAIRAVLAAHWREYLIEGVCLGLFMMSACGFAALLEYPGTPVHQWLEASPVLRRCLMGLAMGLTLAALRYSALGKWSGGHMNPATTLMFYRLDKIETVDAAAYMGAQFLGAIAGTFAAASVIGSAIAHPAVNYVVTRPGPAGVLPAFVAEAVLAFVLMSVVLVVSNRPALNRYTPLAAAALVALYIAIEAPLSGMSMNPARSFGPALLTAQWTSLWIYFTAPPLGMLLAAELYVRRNGFARVLCAKFHHENDRPCIFRCNYSH